MTDLEIALIVILSSIIYLAMGVGFYKLQKQAKSKPEFADVLLWPIGLIMIGLFR